MTRDFVGYGAEPPHPGRAKALIGFIEHILGHSLVWDCRREDIPRHWIARFPPPG